MRLYLCGVRGYTPAPGAEFLRYGGHTSCVAIAHDDAARPTLVLDAGTGLRQVTPLLGGLPFEGTILLSHLHWDHVHGLPFFTAGDRADARVNLLLPEQEDGASAEEALAKGMSPPHFPIPPSGLRGAWTFGIVARGPLKAEGFTIEARPIPHKGGATLGYRVSDGSRTIAYIPDHCPTAIGPGPEGWGEYHRNAVELASGVDLLLHDGFLLPDEVAAEASFGHAAVDYAIGLGLRAGARRVMLTHHKPGRTDDALDQLACRVAEGPADVTVAAEGEILELQLPAKPGRRDRGWLRAERAGGPRHRGNVSASCQYAYGPHGGRPGQDGGGSDAVHGRAGRPGGGGRLGRALAAVAARASDPFRVAA